ncbi:3276d83e-2de8-4598-b906-522247e0224f [Sclerotinia trifoliorum]|uniref:3276d83e-2de8-4598-b906-522247e0224f n=1 Tax=Sclerotinia trifoliorum TaxID=28548 RepID=A0A8H2VS12_9HELO|nr:3276d83e-2de8-4598-b906-522247e0224f [Sclerotinia trifoliorum]
MMGKSIWSPSKWEEWAEKRATAIWTNLQTNNLWQRMLKNTLATTICIIIAIMPQVVAVYGKAAYLAPITTVFGHPGRRFGMMAEALILTLSGTMLGVAWSMLALYLSSLVYHSNPQAAFTIRGIFLAIALLFHGILRSHTPRLFLMVLLLIIVVLVSMTSTATAVTTLSVTQLVYPITTAIAVLLAVNTLVFPEFSSSFLGITTIETLGETVGALRDAGRYFIAITESSESAVTDTRLKNIISACGSGNGEDLHRPPTVAERPPMKSRVNGLTLRQKILSFFQKTQEPPAPLPTNVERSPQPVKLKSLTDKKATLRAKLAGCKAAQQECNFELAWAVLPPRDVKPISDIEMKKLVANTIALIGACESKYALMGDENDKNESKNKDRTKLKSVAENGGVDTSEAEDSSRPTTDMDTYDERSSDEKKPSRKERRKQKNKRRKDRKKDKSLIEKEMENLELIKPRKEIEYGDIDLLKYLVHRIAKPLSNLQEKIDRSVDVVSSSLAYCYDVPKLPSGIRAPAGIRLEEIDIRVDILVDAIADFDKTSAAALEGAAALHDLGGPQVDIMPRMETFLISSFLLNLRQAALHTLGMLRHSRVLVERRQELHGRKSIYLPQINWRKWLQSGGEADMLALPDSARKDARTGKKKEDAADDAVSINSGETLLAKKDVESAIPKEETPVQSPKVADEPVKEKKKGTLMLRFRNSLADIIEYLVGSDDISYAIKLTVAVFIVTWPAFLVQWNTWYSLNRGLWAALQLVVITEVAIGTSVMTFMLRGVGTTIGCVWGYAAYQAGQGNKIVAVVMIVIGIIPSTYIQLGSKYIKAGMVTIISMSIVVLATIDKVVPGSATENFLKRLIAFFIGGVVALIVEVALFPVKARDRLVESLACSIRQITEMEACLAYGIETEINNVNVRSPAVISRFSVAKGKAEGALAAAEAFLPFCANEPRLKGSFAPHALIYGEILYVLHAIVDRMENMLILRHEYGSGVLEELNAQVHPYRRNVAGSITLILFATHEALTTKLPLPQFLPSARLAHLRMVNRVREIVLSSNLKESSHERSEIEVSMVKRFVRQKFLSWNAASAGQIEVIEYLEELIDLVKLLVGANEFRSGLLTRGTYREWVDKIQRPDTVESVMLPADGAVEEKEPQMTSARKRRPTFSNTREKFFGPSAGNATNTRPDSARPGTARPGTARPGTGSKAATTEKLEVEKGKKDMEEELPRVLQRVRTRRMSEMKGMAERRSKEDMANGNAGKGNGLGI